MPFFLAWFNVAYLQVTLPDLHAHFLGGTNPYLLCHHRACPGGTMTDIQAEFVQRVRHHRACPGGAMTERPTRVTSHGPAGMNPAGAYGSTGSFLVISHRSTGVNPMVAGKAVALI